MTRLFQPDDDLEAIHNYSSQKYRDRTKVITCAPANQLFLWYKK